MADKLAKLQDLKDAVNANTAGIDPQLAALLAAASAMAERVAGTAPGGLRRQAGRVEIPSRAERGDRSLYLAARPLESVEQVLQVYQPATDAEFDAYAANDIGLLVKDRDYYIGSGELGILTRIHDWWCVGPRCLRITYTAGFADPDDALGGAAIEPPHDLQRAVVAQAALLWNTRKTPGLTSVKGGDTTGVAEANVHPLLAEAASRYRRYLA